MIFYAPNDVFKLHNVEATPHTAHFAADESTCFFNSLLFTLIMTGCNYNLVRNSSCCFLRPMIDQSRELCYEIQTITVPIYRFIASAPPMIPVLWNADENIKRNSACQNARRPVILIPPLRVYCAARTPVSLRATSHLLASIISRS